MVFEFENAAFENPVGSLVGPIKTQFGCHMVIEKEVEHLEKNKWYWTETKKCYHTAFNGSNEDRIHMVACLL